MNSSEKKIADELERKGMVYIAPDLGKKAGKCIYCGKGRTDFSVATPRGWRMFHTDCQLEASGETAPQ